MFFLDRPVTLSSSSANKFTCGYDNGYFILYRDRMGFETISNPSFSPKYFLSTSKMEEEEELSRWQQLFPSNPNSTQQNYYSKRYEDVSCNLQQALCVQNHQESNIKDWIESIQCAENIIARSNLMEQTDFDTENILVDIDAILERDDLDDEALEMTISNSVSRKDGDKEYNSKVKERNFMAWYLFCQEKRKRLESIIEWFQASTMQKRQRMCLQVWHRQGRFTRTQLQNYSESKQLRQMEKAFCAWFNTIRGEWTQAKVSEKYVRLQIGIRCS